MRSAARPSRSFLEGPVHRDLGAHDHLPVHLSDGALGILLVMVLDQGVTLSSERGGGYLSERLPPSIGLLLLVCGGLDACAAAGSEAAPGRVGLP
jgi:hypothetical protein